MPQNPLITVVDVPGRAAAVFNPGAAGRGRAENNKHGSTHYQGKLYYESDPPPRNGDEARVVHCAEQVGGLSD
jgi:hypothetical protein